MTEPSGDKEKLKTCPVCAGEPTPCANDDFEIWCLKCQLFSYGKTEQDAEKRWNGRDFVWKSTIDEMTKEEDERILTELMK